MVPPIATDAHVDALSSDLPRVKDAVKNLAAVVLAELAAAGDAASQSEPTHSARYDAMPTTQQGVMAAARLLVKRVNDAELPPAPQWGVEHPQAESESATERMESIGVYRAACAMRAHVVASGAVGASVCSMFGRRFLQATRVLEGLADSTDDVGAAAFARAFTAASDGTDAELAKLVWTTDTTAALAAQRRARAAQQPSDAEALLRRAAAGQRAQAAGLP